MASSVTCSTISMHLSDWIPKILTLNALQKNYILAIDMLNFSQIFYNLLLKDYNDPHLRLLSLFLGILYNFNLYIFLLYWLNNLIFFN